MRITLGHGRVHTSLAHSLFYPSRCYRQDGLVTKITTTHTVRYHSLRDLPYAELEWLK